MTGRGRRRPRPFLAQRRTTSLSGEADTTDIVLKALPAAFVSTSEPSAAKCQRTFDDCVPSAGAMAESVPDILDENEKPRRLFQLVPQPR